MSVAGGSDGPPPRATSRTAALIEEVESSGGGDRMKMYIIIAMCVMVLAAAIVGFIFISKKSSEEQKVKDATAQSEEAINGLKALMVSDPENYDKILSEIDKAEQKVNGELFPAKKATVQNFRTEWIGKKEASVTRKANIDLIESLEKEVQDPAKLPGVRLKLDSALRAAGSLEPKKEWEARVAKIKQLLVLNTLKEGVDAAKGKEAAGQLPEALAAYDEAVVKFNKQFDAQGGTAEGPIIDLYKALVADSDRLVERVETPEFESSIQERDMLTAKERPLWGASDGAKWTPSGREIAIEGVKVDKKIQGVVSFLPRRSEAWHDIVLDLEFTIVAGEFDLYLRYWPDKRYYSIKFNAAAGYEANKPYRMTVHVKGSSISLKQAEQPENRDRADPNTSRTGGVGFGINPGSKVIISVCKLKVLRPKG